MANQVGADEHNASDWFQTKWTTRGIAIGHFGKYHNILVCPQNFA